MYSVRIVYPNKPGSTFDWQHYYDVHLPLGIRLLREYRGIQPLKIEVDQQITSDGKDAMRRITVSAPCISTTGRKWTP